MNQQKKYRKDNQKAVDLSTMVYGKVPPQANDMEEAVLGAIMLERDAIDIVNELLKPECFYVNSHQLVYKAFLDLQKAGRPIDVLTVAQQLRTQDELELVGGIYFVTKLTNGVVSAANIEEHCRIVLQKYIQREMIRLCGQTIQMAYEDSIDVFDMVSHHEKEFTALTSGSVQKSYTPIDVAVVKSLERIEHLRNQEAEITGIPSQFTGVDKVTYGWQNSDLIILAARPAVGKTAFALNLVVSSAKAKTTTAFFSLEMSTGQLVNRVIAAESGIHLQKISRGKLEDPEYKQIFNVTAASVSQLPILFDDTPALTILELTSKCRRMKRKQNIGLIILDYLQLMSGDSDRGGNREQEIAKISRGLKKLAKELNVPIIALSQLSRAVESRSGNNKMPQLSDLRESGAIEQDADMVMFMYRPEYYEQNNNELGESTKGETHIRIAKHRNGSLETIKLKANLHIQKFEDWEEYEVINSLPKDQGQKWAPVSKSFYETDKDLPF